MPARRIAHIVIHCAATPNGVALGRRGCTAAETIDDWHRLRGFRRATWRLRVRPHLGHIGYHFVIDTTGRVEPCRELDEVGAHVAGYNAASLGICLVGKDRFTAEQWESLHVLVRELQGKYRDARVCGHRDFSPDKNGDGRITKAEWTKTCPGFDVAAWAADDYRPPATALIDPAQGADR